MRVEGHSGAPMSLAQSPRQDLRHRFLFIENSAAGARRSRLAERAATELAALGAKVTRIYPLSALETQLRAKEGCRSGDFDAIVAVGGDGTIRQVAAGALGGDVPIGVIPTGTANVLAHEIGIPVEPKHLAHMLIAGRVVPIRGGTANGEFFLLMAGIGFDGRVTARVNRTLQRRLGKAAYGRPVLEALCEPLDTLDVTVDDVRYQSTWVVATNCRYYAGAFVLAERASVFDVGLYAVLFQAGSRVAQMFQLVSAATGKLSRRSDVRAVFCERITVRAAHPTSIQIDGDPFGATPLEVRAGQQTLWMITPPCHSAKDITARP